MAGILASDLELGLAKSQLRALRLKTSRGASPLRAAALVAGYAELPGSAMTISRLGV